MAAPDATDERLTDLRNGLIWLHKVLLESEREAYDHSVERVTSSNQLLSLLLTDPWFAWLRELSQLIVYIDELQDNKEVRPTSEDADRVIARTRALLTPSETGTGFAKSYDDAIQRDPDVVLAHGKTVRMLAELVQRGQA